MKRGSDWNDTGRAEGPAGTRSAFDVAAGKAHVRANGKAEAGQCGPIGKLVMTCAADIVPEAVKWLWPGRVAIGKQTLIAGEAGLGKSNVGIAMAAAVSTAGLWPCDEGEAPGGSVIILSAEDGAEDTIVPRLMAAGANRHRVFIVRAVSADDGRERRSFSLQTDLGALEHKISEIGDVRMILIDPISSYLGGDVDSHVNAAVRSVLEPVSEFASRLGVAIVAITHPPKAGGTAAINRFIGSIAFVAAARAAFMVTRDPEDRDRRLLLPVKNNLAPLGNGFAFRLDQRIVGEAGKGIVASCVNWEREHVAVSADEALRATDDNGTGKTQPRAEAEHFLRAELANGPAAVKDIQAKAKSECVSWRTIARVKKTLGVKSVKVEMSGGWHWILPKDASGDEGCHA